MPDNLTEVREFFAKANVPLDRNDVWAVQGTPVVKHKALERLARTLKIKFATPIVLRNERDEAVLLVTGSIGDETEWSIGEALAFLKGSVGLGNYQVAPKQASYPYAMAEKRAKDRVILKLANLAGVYSEEEADEFKQGAEYAPPAERKPESPPATEGELQSLIEQMRSKGRGWKRILDHYGVKTQADLTSAHVADALATLKTLPDAKATLPKPLEEMARAQNLANSGEAA